MAMTMALSGLFNASWTRPNARGEALRVYDDVDGVLIHARAYRAPGWQSAGGARPAGRIAGADAGRSNR